MNENELQELIQFAINSNVPKWLQAFFKKFAANLQVHTKGHIFSKVDTLFPNENPESKKHCVDAYEPITRGSIQKGINDLIRIFNNSSYSVVASDNTLDYLANVNYEGFNFFNWFIKKWIDEAIATDSNEYCAVYPPEYETLTGHSAIQFIPSANIKHISKDTIVFISDVESTKKVDIDNAADVIKNYFYDASIEATNAVTKTVSKSYNEKISIKYEVEVFHVFTKEIFLKCWKVDNEIEYEYIKFKKPHSHVPCFPVGGVEYALGINESFLTPFTYFGNLALLARRNHTAVDLIFSYPRMSEVESGCDNENCDDGYISVTANDVYPTGKMLCPTCKGTKFTTPQSPYKIYKKRMPEGLSNDEETARTIMSTPMVEFYTPPVQILDYSNKNWKELLEMAEQAIFIYSRKTSGGTESFEKANLDLNDKFAWVANISKSYFECKRKTIQSLENYINVNPITVSIEEPTSFAILTEAEAFETLTAIIAADSPIFIKSQKVEDFIKKYISKSSPVIKALSILKKVDPLLFYSKNDISTFKSNYIIDEKLWTVHVLAFPLLMQMFELDKTLYDKDENVIITELKTKIDEVSPRKVDAIKDRLLNV